MEEEKTIDFLKLISEEGVKNMPTSYSAIKNIFFHLNIPVPMIPLNKGMLLYRYRQHIENENYFDKINQISYRPDFYNIKDFGRANEPSQSIFYCSDNTSLACLETSAVLRQNKDKQVEIFTAGVWEIQEELLISTIISHSGIKGINNIFENLTQEFKRLIKEFRNSMTSEEISVLEFISKEFTQNVNGDNSKYKISCAFANYLYKLNGINIVNKKYTELDGIIYPSALYLKDGMNIALKPNVVDSNKIKLLEAKKSIMRKYDNLNYHEEDVVLSKYIDYKNNMIVW